MTRLERFLHYIDRTNEIIGKVVRFALIPLAAVTLFEVVARYVFNSPTIWVWDTNLQIFGIIILLGVGYTQLHNKHISIEAVTEHLPHRARLYCDLLSMLLPIFVAVILIWQGAVVGWESIMYGEKLDTIWHPPIFQIKIMLPVAGLLLLLQSIAKVVRGILALSRDRGNSVT